MTAYRFSACAVCTQQCIPMADFDVAVCMRCDERMTFITEMAATELPIAPRKPQRPLDSFYGPAPKELIDELVRALHPPQRRRAFPRGVAVPDPLPAYVPADRRAS